MRKPLNARSWCRVRRPRRSAAPELGNPDQRESDSWREPGKQRERTRKPTLTTMCVRAVQPLARRCDWSTALCERIPPRSEPWTGPGP
jgi:hypothetical protein